MACIFHLMYWKNVFVCNFDLSRKKPKKTKSETLFRWIYCKNVMKNKSLCANSQTENVYTKQTRWSLQLFWQTFGGGRPQILWDFFVDLNEKIPYKTCGRPPYSNRGYWTQFQVLIKIHPGIECIWKNWFCVWLFIPKFKFFINWSKINFFSWFNIEHFPYF